MSSARYERAKAGPVEAGRWEEINSRLGLPLGRRLEHDDWVALEVTSVHHAQTGGVRFGLDFLGRERVLVVVERSRGIDRVHDVAAFGAPVRSGESRRQTCQPHQSRM